MKIRMCSRYFILLLLFFLASCSNSPNTALHFGLASQPSNLDPLFATDATSTRIDRLLFQRLVHFDKSSQVIPGIANWHKISDTHYRFVLNDKVKPFHDETRLSSADIKATYDFILDPNNSSPHRSSLTLIDNITTPDKQTTDFFLNRIDPLFPAYLAVGIVPKSLLDTQHAFNQQPIGSGPFKFLNKTDDGKIALLRRKDQKLIEFVYVPDPTVRILKLMRGELDIIQNDIQPELIDYLSNKDNVTIDRIPGSNFSYIGFNMMDKALSQKEIRQAIALSINRQEIINFMFKHSARKAQAILSGDHWAGNPSLKTYNYNPKQAQKLLLNLGYSFKNPLQLTFKTSSDPFRLRLATIYQHQLAKVGIQLDIRSYDWGTFFGDIKAGRFQLYSLSWVGINTPDIFRYTSHSDSIPPKGANRGRYIDETTDQLIEQAESQMDFSDQAKYYALLQAHLLQELPYVPLWYEDHVVVKNHKVKNYHVSSQGHYDGLINAEF